jgi:SecD/SecF fusion protein
MKRDQLGITVLILISLVCLYIIVPIPNKPILEDKKIKLGIDLNGGIEVRYRVFDPNRPDKKITAKDCQDVIEVLRRRIDTEGLTEPIMNVSGEDQIIIQLAGVDLKGWVRYKKIVEEQGILELSEVASKDIQEKVPDDKAPTDVPAGWRAVKNEDRHGDKPYDKLYILVSDRATITGADLQTASAEPDPRRPGYWRISFKLKADAAKRMGELTTKLVHKGKIAILLDGKCLSKPNVEGIITDSGEITGSYSRQEAQTLANILVSGSLPYAVGRKVGSEHVKGVPEIENEVGPTLGQDSIRRGMLAVVVAVSLIALFMLIYYRAGGVIAVVSLVLNMVFLLTILIFLGAALTLPGIAGLALTIGMAVDANILIMERIREEQKKGKTAIQAYEHATNRATITIVDSNLTTLMIGFVLYFFGSGSVKGFAVTLSLGILTTLLSVLYCGGMISRYLLHSGSIKKFSMIELFKPTNINFVRMLKPFGVISLLLVIGGVVMLTTNGDKSLGLDFTGGSEVTFQLSEPERIDTVREKIKSIPGTSGAPKYADANVQTMSDTEPDQVITWGRDVSRGFKLRTRGASVEELRLDIQNIFKDKISHDPFEQITAEQLKEIADRENLKIYGKDVVAGFYLYLKSDGFDSAKVIKQIEDSAKDVGVTTTTAGAQTFVNVKAYERKDPPKGLVKLLVVLTKEDADRRDRLKESIISSSKSRDSAIKLSLEPFLSQSTIGPAAAKELVETALLAIFISWVLMIAYIAIRFFMSFNFGVAAVIALVHDAIVSVGIMIVMGMVVPKALGFDFDLTLNTMAAVLTIIGYSVNDTIVIFDRIRENLVLNKKASFADIINWSVNQTLSRTILTSFTVWVSVVVMYVFTMTSASGISTLMFPLIIGVLAGTYSTVYVAAPILMLLYGGKRPQIAVT